MLIGVIADSHDNLPAVEKAVATLNQKKVGMVIHAGDFIAPFAIKPMANLACTWIGVFGNNDGEQKGLTSLSKGRIQPAPYELNLDGKKVLVVHDLDTVDKEEVHRAKVQLVIYGHTHEPEIKKDSQVLYVNPGELGGWLSGTHTFALVDTEKLEAQIEEISL